MLLSDTGIDHEHWHAASCTTSQQSTGVTEILSFSIVPQGSLLSALKAVPSRLTPAWGRALTGCHPVNELLLHPVLGILTGLHCSASYQTVPREKWSEIGTVL